MGFPLGYLSIVPKTFFLTAYWSSTKGKRSNNFKISAVLHRLWRKTNTDIKTMFLSWIIFFIYKVSNFGPVVERAGERQHVVHDTGFYRSHHEASNPLEIGR